MAESKISSRTGLLLDPVFKKHRTGEGHPECPARYDAITRDLEAAGLVKKLAALELRDLSDDEALLCHSKDYLTKNAALAQKLETVLPQLMSLTPRGIRNHLDLNQAIYARTAAYGHFGRTPDIDGGFSWEKTDLVDAILKAV